MKQLTIKYFERLLKHMTYYNNMSPFPIFDTEYLEDVKDIIMKLNKKEEYEEIPVVACKYCKSLYILNDDLENDICARCGSINDIEVYPTIEEYLKTKE